jgi:uncharacterized membrane protein SpoIIM required for sporulation
VEILQRYYDDGVPSNRQLFYEGGFVAMASTGFAYWLFPAEVSLVSVCLAAIACSDSVERLLEWNRRLIYEDGYTPPQANARLTQRVFWLFIGAMVGFSALGMALPLDSVHTVFAHQVADYGDRAFPDIVFGTFGQLMRHNLYVLLFFLLVAIPFRQGGVLFAVVWNASVWGPTFALLARRWAEMPDAPHSAMTFLYVIGATLPHLALEAGAYILAGFAGVLLSRAIARHRWNSPKFGSVSRSVFAMLVLGLILMTLGAAWEANMAPYLVRLLTA